MPYPWHSAQASAALLCSPDGIAMVAIVSAHSEKPRETKQPEQSPGKVVVVILGGLCAYGRIGGALRKGWSSRS
jgi:hypothetical protein